MPAMGQFSKEIPAPRGAGQSPKEDEDLDGLAAIHGIRKISRSFCVVFSGHRVENCSQDFFTHIFRSLFAFFPTNSH
ncbi:MAG TPA: hypothetical protein DCE12_01920 [Gammaproteobacteria bacterium]|nr:hypothetical protein [Acidiferrobacter sp.]MBR42575.1 hypothetical protein [Acidiferrobacter sp.]HAA35552.1 hypothetical protein [Gammaproteobacteria bacterium]